jgi:hypothetical protein
MRAHRVKCTYELTGTRSKLDTCAVNALFATLLDPLVTCTTA